MKIGVLTYWSSLNNYGQQLQLYALQKYLKQNGHDVFLIRYDGSKNKSSIFQKVVRFLKPSTYINRFSKQGRLKRKEYIENCKISELNNRLDSIRNFENFRILNIDMTDCVYHSLSEIQKNPPIADLYIVGSDQVWRDSLLDVNSEVWYLNFGKKQTKRISYAASIGRDISKPEIQKFKRLLSSFDAVSVREHSALQQVLSIGRNDAIIVLDPTLLLESICYMKLCSNISVVSERYLFVYILNVQKPKDLYCDEIVEYTKRNNLCLKTVASSGYFPARELFDNNTNILATIPHWLSLIRDAESVITTSFHGIVFSILMHKPFLAVLLKGELSSANVRLISLLDSIGLSDRVYDSNKSLCDQMNSKIDWEIVDKKLEALKILSKQFISTFAS